MMGLHMVLNKELYQSDESYKKTLQELSLRVDTKVKLDYEDSCEIGNKYTECNLGLCDRSIQDNMDGTYRANQHICPHDGRYFDRFGNTKEFQGAIMSSGCFYDCHIFQNTGNYQNLIEQRIKKVAG